MSDGSRRPLVSIVTPSYQQARYIQATLESVDEQTYPHIEHLVVDGGSTDGTVEILREAATRSSVRWVSEPDHGQGDAINKGLRMTTGEIVTWLNSDDVYVDAEAIETVVREFERGATAVTGAGYWLAEDGARRGPIPVYPRRVRHDVAMHVDWFLQPATFYSRELALRHTIDPTLRYAFDWDLFIRMTSEVTFTCIRRPIAGYRVHDKGKTVAGGLERRRELLLVLRRHSPDAFRTRVYGAMVGLYEAAARLPRPLAHVCTRALTIGARLTNRFSGGRGLPS